MHTRACVSSPSGFRQRLTPRALGYCLMTMLNSSAGSTCDQRAHWLKMQASGFGMMSSSQSFGLRLPVSSRQTFSKGHPLVTKGRQV
jgi:hypothetical protein